MAGGRPHVVDTLAVESTGANAAIIGGAPGASTGTGGLKAGAIVGATFAGDGALITALNATALATGTVPTARLGSGSANATTFLRGDQTYAIPGGLALLKSESGTHTAGAATNVSTYAMASGLTILDSLLVVMSVSVITANMGGSFLYNSTDSVNIALLNSGSAYTAGITNRVIETHWIRADASSALLTTGFGLISAGGGAGNPNATLATFTTAWTGAWTLALRLGAVTATGSCSWSWAVYKLAGQ